MVTKTSLPTDWEFVKAIDHIDFIRGQEPGSKHYNTKGHGQKFIRVGNMSGKREEAIFTDLSNLSACNKSDILMSFDGSPGIVRRGFEGIYSSGIRKIIFKNTRFDRNFTYYVLQSSIVQDLIAIHADAGTTIKHASKSIPLIRIPAPPISEQKKIAAILSSVDGAIQATQAVIDQTRRVKQGLLQQLLTCGIGHTRFKQTEIGEIPEEWCIKTAKEVCSKISVGIVVKPTQYYESNGIKCFRSANVREGYIEDHNWVYISEEANNLNAKSKLHSGDVLIVRTGYPGTSCVVPQEYDGTNCIDIIFARPKVGMILSQYLSCFINSSLGKKQVLYGQGGLAQKHFNVNALNQMKIVLPSIYEQKKITTILTNMDNVLNIELDKMVQIQKIKRGLMQDLLTGRVRVKLDEMNTT